MEAKEGVNCRARRDAADAAAAAGLWLSRWPLVRLLLGWYVAASRSVAGLYECVFVTAGM